MAILRKTQAGDTQGHEAPPQPCRALAPCRPHLAEVSWACRVLGHASHKLQQPRMSFPASCQRSQCPDCRLPTSKGNRGGSMAGGPLPSSCQRGATPREHNCSQTPASVRAHGQMQTGVPPKWLLPWQGSEGCLPPEQTDTDT